MQVKCYICGSTSAKQCTGCHTISYCSVSCQKKDWPYHKHSCKSSSKNVIDSLINTNVLDHLVKEIFHYLSGKDLHYIRCVKRSWRDIVDSMWQSKVDRNLFEAKLAQQWKQNKPRARWLYEGHGLPAQSMKHSEQELFLACHDQSKILVLDMDDMHKVTYISRWQTKTKYSIKIGNPTMLDFVWDVHKNFVMVWDASEIKCVDRKTQKEMIICDESKKLQVGDKITVRFGDKRRDIPEKICIFGDVVIIVYLSGLILKFSVKVTSKCESQKKIATFKLLHRFEELLGCSHIDSDQIKISHGKMSNCSYYFGCTRIYSKHYQMGDDDSDDDDDDNDGGDIWCLEDEEQLKSLDDLVDVLAVTRIGDDDYCLMLKKCDCIGEYNYEKPNADLMFPNEYLEIWRNKECLRSFKVKGLHTAQLNQYTVTILAGIGLPAYLTCYSLKDFIDDGIRSKDLTPILYTSFKVYPSTLLLTKNQIIWSISHDYGEVGCFLCYREPCSRDNFSVNSLNFWYSPFYPPHNQEDIPQENVMCTFHKC